MTESTILPKVQADLHALLAWAGIFARGTDRDEVAMAGEKIVRKLDMLHESFQALVVEKTALLQGGNIP